MHFLCTSSKLRGGLHGLCGNDVKMGIWDHLSLSVLFSVSFIAVGASLVAVGLVRILAALCCCHVRITRVTLFVYSVLTAAGLCRYLLRVLLRNVLNDALVHYIAGGLANPIHTHYVDLFQILDNMLQNGGQFNLISAV